jgi:hypothetical protein
MYSIEYIDEFARRSDAPSPAPRRQARMFGHDAAAL